MELGSHKNREKQSDQGGCYLTKCTRTKAFGTLENMQFYATTPWFSHSFAVPW